MEAMEKKTWYKPAQGSGIIKSGDLKNILKKSEDPSLVECLYLDTADMSLIENGAVLMIADDGKELKQMAVFADEGAEGEYVTQLPDSGVDLTLFPENVYEKFCSLLNGSPLQIRFVSSFELKKRVLTMDGIPVCHVVRLLSHYEEGGERRELCMLSVQSMEESSSEAPTAEQMAALGDLTPCAPPYIEAMRLCASECNPAVDEKRIKKAAAIATARLFGIRLFDLIRAYVGLGTAHFDKTSILKLRVAARKLTALIEAFVGVFGEKAASCKAFLNRLIDDTDAIRAIDLLIDEMDTVASMHHDFDFAPLDGLLNKTRETLCHELLQAYEDGGYADELAAFWVQTHKKMHEGLLNEDIIKATEKIREWTVELNVYKKAEMAAIENMHAYRKTIRHLRYALEGLSEITVKRLSKAIKSCKKLQDEFGMAADMSSHIKTLQKLSEEEGSAQLALLCGVCCGVFAESLPDMLSEAVGVWKDCRNDIKALEDTL